MKKAIAIISVIILIASILITCASAEDKGTFGSGLMWEFNEETGELIISGTGSMPDFRGSHRPSEYPATTKGITGTYTTDYYEPEIPQEPVEPSIIKEMTTESTTFRTTTVLETTTTTEPYTENTAVPETTAQHYPTYTGPNGLTTDLQHTLPSDAWEEENEVPWFDYKLQITTVIIEEGITNISAYAFENCCYLTSISIADSVRTIGRGAFYDCDNLTSITIPDSVTSIGDKAFFACVSLKNVEIGDGVKSIGYQAFSSCDKLERITIPASVKDIENSAFPRSDSFVNITVDEANPSYSSDKDGVLFNKDKTVLICYPTGRKNTSYTIPDTVKTIGTESFFACENLEFVIIPDSVNSIGDRAFGSCTYLKSIIIPDSVVSIGVGSFSFCQSLENITFGKNVETIGSEAFFCCYSLTEIIIPDSIINIADNTFAHCSSLVSVKLGNSVKTIGDYAFEFCPELTGIVFPDSLTGIGEFAFSGCHGLTHITIPASVTGIGVAAFVGCSQLSGITVDGANPEYSSDEYGVLFNKDKTIIVQYPTGNERSSYTVPSTVEEVAPAAFAYCDSLAEITINSGVTSINTKAFFECRNLTSMHLPSSLNSVGDSAFDFCYNLTEVYYQGAEDQWNQIDFGLGNDFLLNSTVHYIVNEGTCGDNLTWVFNPDTGELVISGTGDMYNYTESSDAPWYNCRNLITMVMIENGVTSIGDYAFQFYDKLTSVRISDSVTIIGDYALYGCFSLSNITADKNNPVYSSDESEVLFNKDKTVLVQYPIGNERSHYTIPDSVTTIGCCAFTYCDKLTSVTIPDSVMSISETAFTWCGTLEDIVIPDSVTHIGRTAFAYCYSLKNATIGNGVNRISEYAFAFSNQLEKVTIPDSVVSIDQWAFACCESLKTIKLPESVKVIGENAFLECTSLVDLVIPQKVTDIGAYAFSYCRSLKSVTIPESVTSIGDGAFRVCDVLVGITVDGNNLSYSNDEYGVLFNKDKTELIQYPNGAERPNYAVPDGVIRIGDCAFEGCDLTEILISDSVISIGSYAFFDCNNLKFATIGDSVISIGNRTFSDCDSLTSITIPDNVTSIGDDAFSYCYNLTSITIGDSVTSIGDDAFFSCDSLETVYYNGTQEQWKKIDIDPQDNEALFKAEIVFLKEDDEITSSPCGENLTWEFNKETGELVISGTGVMYDYNGDIIPWCNYRSSIKKVTISNGVTSIGSSAFYDCTSLTSITIPHSVTSIGSDAFYGCTSLTSITIPDGVTSIGHYAFCFCTSLTSITVAEGNTVYSSDEYGALFNKDKTELIQYPVGNERTNYTVPEGVTIIGDSAFGSCSGITEITIPDSVTYIGDVAFYQCTNIKKIVIPDNVTRIGYWTFNECTNLTSIKVGYNVKSIETGAFSGCTNLTNITIFDNVIRIGEWAFDNTGYFNDSSNWEDGVLYIGNHIIKADENLSGTYAIRKGTRCIADEAFYSCSNLTDIVIPDGVTGIGRYAFRFCSSITNITIPDSVTVIGAGAFGSCNGLTSITIPGSVTIIDGSTFYYCENLTNVTISEGVRIVDNFAFDFCTSLTSITIPDSVTSIGSCAFNECNALDAVYYGGTQTQWDGITIGEGNEPLLNAEIVFLADDREIIGSGECGEKLAWEFNKETDELVISGTGEMWNWNSYSDVPWKAFLGDITSVHIGDEVTSIGDYAFSKCTALTSASIGNGVASIGDYAFFGCNRLMGIVISENVSSIGQRAFGLCRSLTAISVNENNPEYCSDVNGVLFNKDKTLLIQYPAGKTDIAYIIPDSVIDISDYAFNGCKSLRKITIPNSVINIGEYAFGSCSGLSDVTIPEGVVTIGNSAFSGCTGIESIIIPDSVISIGSGAFADCSGMIEAVIGNGVTDIGADAFKKCINLKTITIGNSVNVIGDSAFWSCENLESVVIPDSVTVVGDRAFAFCNRLTSVILGNNVTEIGSDAFDWSGIKTINIPASVISLGKEPLGWCSDLTGITVDEANTAYSSDEYGVLFNKDKTKLIKYPEGNSRTSYEIPETVVRICDSAFQSSDALENITIPKSVTSIGQSAFMGCSSLENVSISVNVTEIGSRAFLYCYSLTTIKVDEANPNYSSDEYGVLFNKDKTMLIQYPAGRIDTDYVIPVSVQVIGDFAFESAEALESISIQEGVTYIGDNTFQYCDSLKEITIPSSVTYIGESAFDFCNRLVAINVDEANPEYSSDEFGVLFNKDKTVLIRYPADHSRDFYSIPESVIVIEHEAFIYCRYLSSVFIPHSVTDIDNSAFFTCPALTFIAVDEANPNYSSDEHGVLFNKDKTQLIQYPSGNKSNIYVIPKSVTIIDNWAFNDSVNLKSLVIPYSVSDICYEAFNGCYSLRDIYYVGTAPYWELTEIDETNECLLNAKLHYCEKVIGYPSDCENEGRTDGLYCPDCDEIIAGYELVPSVGHDYEITETPATCTTSGRREGVCLVCGYTFSEKIYALGHDLDYYKIESTCTQHGYECYKCIECGAEFERKELELMEHILFTIRKEPTCIKIGAEQYVCEVCGNLVGDPVILPKIDHSYGEWIVVKDSTATEDGSKEHSCTVCGKTEVVAISATGFEIIEGVIFDFATNTISGFNVGATSLDSYTTIVNDNYIWEYETSNGKLGTGSKAILKDGDTVIGEYTILVYGDTNGDSWYDGQDAVLVSCLASGMLTKDDVSEAVYMAADCNHDGVIDRLDVDLLNQAGTLLANVDQSKPTEVLLETSSEYVEYLDLIDQSPEIEIEDETDTPEADAETEDTTPEQDKAEVNIFEMIINFIKSVFEMLFACIPVPLK